MVPSEPEVTGVFGHIRISVSLDFDMSSDPYGAYPNYLEKMFFPLVCQDYGEHVLPSAG